MGTLRKNEDLVGTIETQCVELCAGVADIASKWNDDFDEADEDEDDEDAIDDEGMCSMLRDRKNKRLDDLFESVSDLQEDESATVTQETRFGLLSALVLAGIDF